MQQQLVERNKKELEAQKQKYEAMLDELRKNAAGDKEFVVNELKKKIVELEKQIETMRSDFATEREKMLTDQQQLQAKHEHAVAEMRKEHTSMLTQLKQDHKSEVDTLS